jgi:hypothetical protein
MRLLHTLLLHDRSCCKAARGQSSLLCRCIPKEPLRQTKMMAEYWLLYAACVGTAFCRQPHDCATGGTSPLHITQLKITALKEIQATRTAHKPAIGTPRPHTFSLRQLTLCKMRCSSAVKEAPHTSHTQKMGRHTQQRHAADCQALCEAAGPPSLSRHSQQAQQQC